MINRNFPGLGSATLRETTKREHISWNRADKVCSVHDFKGPSHKNNKICDRQFIAVVKSRKEIQIRNALCNSFVHWWRKSWISRWLWIELLLKISFHEETMILKSCTALAVVALRPLELMASWPKKEKHQNVTFFFFYLFFLFSILQHCYIPKDRCENVW